VPLREELNLSPQDAEDVEETRTEWTGRV